MLVFHLSCQSAVDVCVLQPDGSEWEELGLYTVTGQRGQTVQLVIFIWTFFFPLNTQNIFTRQKSSFLTSLYRMGGLNLNKHWFYYQLNWLLFYTEGVEL